MKLSKGTINVSAPRKRRIYERIRMAILTGEIPGGERLVEMDLATKMRASRTPVREALQKIAMEGLIYSIPRAGYIVGEMSEYDLQDLFTARIYIEQAAAKLALENITAEESAQLELNLKKSPESLMQDLNDKMIDFDTEFHSIICRASRNNRLNQFSQMLRDHLLKYRMISLRDPEIAKQAIAEHVLIFEAIQAKSPEGVEETIRDHLESAKRNILMCLVREHQSR